MRELARIWAIARFEFLRYFKWKQELFTLGLIALGLMAGAFWPFISGMFHTERQIAFAVAAPPPAAAAHRYVPIADQELETALAELGELWDGVVQVRGEGLELRVMRRADWQNRVRAELAEWARLRRLEQLPLAEEERALLLEAPTVEVAVEGGDEDSPLRGVLSMVSAIMLMVGVTTCGALMMMSITTEKQQRVTEQLLTLVSARQWMAGKIVGGALLALKAMLTVALVVLVVVVVLGLVQGGEFGPIPWWPLLNSLLFLVLGILLVSSFFAGFFATIDDPNHSSRSIVMLLPMLPVMFAFSVAADPESGLGLFLSLFPLTSYAAMPARLVAGAVPLWQWGLSLLLLAGTIWSMRNMAARLFAMGIQMYGKEPGWGDIFRAIRGRA